jgi:hypothetical protein
MVPLSQRAVFDVVVWTIESVFVQVTVSPTLIVMVAGLKELRSMLTEVVAAHASVAVSASRTTITIPSATMAATVRGRLLAGMMVWVVVPRLIVLLLDLRGRLGCMKGAACIHRTLVWYRGWRSERPPRI